jgi:hypothetical protein
METSRVQIPGPVYSCMKEAKDKMGQRNKYGRKEGKKVWDKCT